MKAVRISDVLHAISDDASLELFRLVAITANGSSDVLRNRMKITRKQYYSRLRRLVQCGLVKRTGNVYVLTAIGKVLYDAQATIESALENYWKMKAVDSLGVDEGIPLEEQKRLIGTLIDNHEIRNILAK